MLNALAGESLALTGATRARDDRGCHTTTRRPLTLLSKGRMLLDTPGIREWGIRDGASLEGVFGDQDALGERCRCRDCRHEGEPGCALAEAVERGGLDPLRLDHYLKLQRERAAWELRQAPRARREASRRLSLDIADYKKTRSKGRF